MTSPVPALPAKIHPLVRAFLDTPGAAEDALVRFGSPAHLVFPQVFAENLRRLRAVLDRRLPRHRICYAHKVNRSRAFLRTAEHAGISVDVASPQELASAVDAGFGPMRIEVTGPKGESFLRELIDAAVTVNVDNLWELRRIAELTGERAKVPVLLRLSGFAASAISRFGIPLDEAEEALRVLSAHRARIALRGFAFHIDSGEPAERVRAVEACLELIETAYGYGLTPAVLDIGGGFRQVFTADPDRFDHYVAALREALLGRGEPMTWGGNTFGFHLDDTGVRGTPVFHKYANTVPATRMLDDLLRAPLDAHGGRTIAQVAGENLLELWLEPGKSLVDHAGITVARVEFVKRAADGSVLVNLDLSRDTVTPADQEVMVDPIVVRSDAHRDAARPVYAVAAARPGDTVPALRPVGDQTEPVGVYFAGRLCLERDLITNHKVWLAERPRPGDLVVFPNTAAYHSDLSAASASMHPLPPKLAVAHRSGAFQVCRDVDYEPARRLDGRP
ncbi:diaminopimelate decarboxylase [Nocardia transvalensis]|uniref:Diaminopimelate decarboxylase n=1 Tax=Nocardia transvalensis TaxID=37333 RepID=A0A7W9UKE1_9NOCA|nr:alanine racemase [Nocardia transvalensis]MBB5916336.1 diaminopimelate decarboxylase [Nocardia transvalensis]